MMAVMAISVLIQHSAPKLVDTFPSNVHLLTTALSFMTVMSNEQALLSHVCSQVEQNIDFLVSHHYIAASDASSLLQKLSTVNPANQGQTQRAVVMPTPHTPAALAPPMPSRAPALPQAEALWDYNVNGQVCGH